MEIPLTIADYLDRAERVYGDRVAIIDEPDQPAPPLPDITYSRLAELSRGMAAGFDELGLETGARVAMVSHNAARLLVFLFGSSAYGRVGVPINFRLSTPEIQYILDHSGAEVLFIDPELAEQHGSFNVKHQFVIGPEADQIFIEGVFLSLGPQMNLLLPLSTTQVAPPPARRVWR